MTKDEMKNKISMALKDPILQQGFEIICKENEELKRDKERLTKAKKIIGNLYATCKDNHYPDSSVLMEQAEQFLKETADIREDSTLDGDWVVDEH